MRKYLSLVIDAPEDEAVGKVMIRDSPPASLAGKNEVGTAEYSNIETGNSWEETEVGLGYHDFEDEDDYKERLPDVIHRKLEEIDDEHLEAAGVVL